MFEANIAGAYTPDAYVKQWIRKLIFDRNTSAISLSETYKLNKFVKPFELNFITILDVDLKDESNGTVVLKNKTIKLFMKFDKNQFDVRVDQHKFDDKKLTDEWDQLYINRVVLVSKERALEGKHRCDLLFVNHLMKNQNKLDYSIYGLSMLFIRIESGILILFYLL